MTKFRMMYLVFAMFLLTVFVVGSVAVLADSGQTTSSGNNSTSTNDSSGTQNSSHEQDGVTSSLENEQQRNIHFEIDNSSHEIQVSSELNTGNIHNEIQFNLNAEKIIQLNFQYQSRIGTNQTNLGIKIEFRKLIEFVDNTSNVNNTLGGFDAADKILNILDFRYINWSLGASVTNISGQTIYSAMVTGQATGTSVHFVFHFATSFVYLNNKTFLQPTAVKFDINIYNYTYNAINSQLALESVLKSQLKSYTISNHTEDEQYNLTTQRESGINFGSSQYGGFFTWTNNVLVDGQNQTVVTSSIVQNHEDASYNNVYFSFPHGSNISWDPKVGADYNATGITFGPISSAPGFDFLPVIIVFPILGLVALLSHRKKYLK